MLVSSITDLARGNTRFIFDHESGSPARDAPEVGSSGRSMPVRSLLIALACALPSAALAESREPRRYDPVPPVALGVAAALHTHKLAGLVESGHGVNLELALGRSRWQYFAEASWARVVVGPDDDMVGRQLRGGIGVRWLARSFRFEDLGSTDLVLEVFTGVQRFGWDGGGALARPDVGFGIGWQTGVVLKDRQILLRSVARASFAPVERERVAPVCRGSCTMPVHASNSGLTVHLGFQW
jgi:hypothetical protein